MFSRDFARLQDCRKRLNFLPLGAAALAGTGYNIDREFVAKELGFDGVCKNSLDAVSDRDFAIEFSAAAAMIMMHISRLSEELVLWMNQRFGYIKLSDGFCTGSSIMPQKKNPDVPELARGKTGRVYGNLTALLTLMKSQPLAYNKDNQEDKEPLFDSIDTLIDTLSIFTEMLQTLKTNPKPMAEALRQGFATATDLADYLVRKGVAFRDAHAIVGAAVKSAEQKNCDLAELSLAELQEFCPQNITLSDDVYSKALTVEAALKARNHVGGTAVEQVLLAVKKAKENL